MSIRAELTRAHQDQTDLIKRVQEKAKLVEQLCEEAKIKEAETLSVKGESLARSQKVEELETRLTAELARATSEEEALVASFRANAEAVNTRAKKLSNAAEVRLSRVAEHARLQSRRETLEEVHARGFDLTADIESAKILEDEARALLSDGEDSASESESGGDEDEAPEDAAPEAD
ncbi:uncharacterized protein [Nicotiana tomentosiformis]|uniref:uncharacterized protein n=1 Tax=Nicotiana tomentosiformis TaxID=4098 RepID=UPI00388C8513